MQIWSGKNVDIKAWVDGVLVESGAIDQLRNVSELPFIYKHLAVMPDVHIGVGATIGSVIPTKGAVIPSAVGVDIGCGVNALPTSIILSDIPIDKRHFLRLEIEKLIPTGRSNSGGKGDKGAWKNIPKDVQYMWQSELEKELDQILKKHPGIRSRHGLNDKNHLGTLGGGNHFIEICVDLNDRIWILLHSGSRGIGNRIGQYFIQLAKNKCLDAPISEIKRIEKELKDYFNSSEFYSLPNYKKKFASEKKKFDSARERKKLSVKLPHSDLAYFTEDMSEFHDYIIAVLWAQKYAKISRSLMIKRVVNALENIIGSFKYDYNNMISCHHNYVNKEIHFCEEIFVTRKGAISACIGEKAIIPGSMGSKSYIVEGLGNEESFCSASHGAGRSMSRSEAKKIFTIEDHIRDTEGIECVKNSSVIDETPGAYKSIDDVMNAQVDLVKPIEQLKQIICVKGSE